MVTLGYEQGGTWHDATTIYDIDWSEVERHEDGSATVHIYESGKGERVVEIHPGETYTYTEEDGTKNTIYCYENGEYVQWDTEHPDGSKANVRYSDEGEFKTRRYADGNMESIIKDKNGNTTVTTYYDDGNPATANPKKTVSTRTKTDIWGNKTTTTTTTYPDGTQSTEVSKEQGLITGGKNEIITTTNSDGTREVRVIHHDAQGNVSYDDPKYTDKFGRTITKEEYEKSAENDQNKTKEFEKPDTEDKPNSKDPKEQDPNEKDPKEPDPDEKNPKETLPNDEVTPPEAPKKEIPNTAEGGAQANQDQATCRENVSNSRDKLDKAEGPGSAINYLKDYWTTEGGSERINALQGYCDNLNASKQSMMTAANTVSSIEVKLNEKTGTASCAH